MSGNRIGAILLQELYITKRSLEVIMELMQGMAQRVTAVRPDLVNTDASFGELAWIWGEGHAADGGIRCRDRARQAGGRRARSVVHRNAAIAR